MDDDSAHCHYNMADYDYNLSTFEPKFVNILRTLQVKLQNNLNHVSLQTNKKLLNQHICLRGKMPQSTQTSNVPFFRRSIGVSVITPLAR